MWQDESYERLVRDEEEFARILRHIEVNPAHAGLVTEPQRYPWSSAGPISNRPQVSNLPHDRETEMQRPARMATGACAVALSFFAGYSVPRREKAAATSRAILYYACPMHPQYRSERPGDAPCCGMRMEPVYAGSERKTGLQTGVVAGTVERAPFEYAVRYPGRIAVDETRLFRWNAAVSGWVRSVSRHTSGSMVRKGEAVATYYAPEFLAAEQAYLFALATRDRYLAAHEGEEQLKVGRITLQVAADTLRSLGMSEAQLEELERTRAVTKDIKVYAPATGFIVARNISEGQRFERGYEFYRFADLSHVWLLADVLERDRELARPGAAGTVNHGGRSFQARMSDVLPQFDPATRTLKARFELDNPGYALRPDEFVELDLHVSLPATVHIPAEALVDSGLRKAVYVERGGGTFEPREVETGWRAKDRVEIVRGLKPGERIALAGTFLLDSESRMRAASTSAPADDAAIDSVCGMEVDAGSSIRAFSGGKTVLFCSEACRREFEGNRAKYERKGARGPA